MGHQTFQFLKRNVCQVGRGDEFFLPPRPPPPAQIGKLPSHISRLYVYF